MGDFCIVGRIKQTHKTDIDVIEEESAMKLFELPKRIHQEVGNTSARNAVQSNSEEFFYLWVFVTEAGIAQSDEKPARSEPLNLEEWLNVIDEAASLGVNWFVVSLKSGNLAQHPEIWSICQWAQDVHNMTVGLQTNAPKLLPEETEAIKQLDPEKTRVMLCDAAHKKADELKTLGYRLCVPNDDHHENAEEVCTRPKKMVFVNAYGELYTCGLVDGQEEYKLGSVLQDPLYKVLNDPNLPHTVHNSAVKHKAHGCDGCPPLMIRYFEEAEKEFRSS